MEVLSFHDVRVDRSLPARDALLRLRDLGFAVTGDYDEEFRLLNEEPPSSPEVKLALARLTSPLSTTDAFERFARENGVRLATLRETAALAAARPDLFAAEDDAPVVVMDPLKIAGDGETWVPVFPADAPNALGVEPIGNYWGPVRFPVVQL